MRCVLRVDSRETGSRRSRTLLFGPLSNLKKEVSTPKHCFVRVYNREMLRFCARTDEASTSVGSFQHPKVELKIGR